MGWVSVSAAISAPLRLILLLLVLAGCASTRTMTVQTPANNAEEVIARYNANALRLKRVWARAAAFVHYRDPDGKMQRQQGDGVFLFVRPDRVTLTTGKLGRTLMLAGNNDRRFWLFDLQDDGVAYVGSYARLGEPGTQTLPMPVRPDRFPALLGLLPIDGADAYTEWHGGDLLVEPRWGARRLLLDARTGLVRRVDLLDDAGHSVIVCELTGEKTLKQENDDAPTVRIPAEAAIRVVGEDGDVVLKLSDPTDNPDKFKDALFDLDALMQQYKPQRVVDLDGMPPGDQAEGTDPVTAPQ